MQRDTMSQASVSTAGPTVGMDMVWTTIDILYRLSSSDIWTFVVPNTMFGFCTAFCASMWDTGFVQSEAASDTINTAMGRIVKAFLWNWLNLLLFNLANQRLPDAIAEDKLNKPYRPLPSGLLSQDSARRALLYGIFAVVWTSYFFLGAHQESIIMVGLTWMYNDLRGGDENFGLRNFIIAIAFGVYNHASSKIVRGSTYDIKTGLEYNPRLAPAGSLWIVLVSLVIFTTMQIQDLQDVDGDRQRGRRSLMIVAGMRVSRWLTALPILFWCGALPYLLGIPQFSFALLLTQCVGVWTAGRVIWLTNKKDDNKSWKMWALWLMVLYTLPLTV